MLIYFDESYDNKHHWLILGAAFHPRSRYLHRKISKIKKKHGFITQSGELKELKYSKCSGGLALKVAKECTDAFFESEGYFRAVVIEQGAAWFDLSMFGKNDPKKLKWAKMYTKFAEMLICHNTEKISNGVLLTDELSRCNGDRFIQVMGEFFSKPGKYYSIGKNEATLKLIQPVNSKSEEYQVLQITDLFTGAILNSIVPTKEVNKTKISEYIAKKAGVKDLSPSSWPRYSKTYTRKHHKKFSVWYWKPLNKKIPRSYKSITDRQS